MGICKAWGVVSEYDSVGLSELSTTHHPPPATHHTPPATPPMTVTRLLLRNLLWYWRANLAVLLGVVVGTAVLTGALVVGDSLRGSLRAMALEQLGWVDSSLVASRLFREELARDIPAARVGPAILLQSSASTVGPEAAHVHKVTILAVDDRFWPADAMPMDTAFWQSSQAGVILNHTLAERLRAKSGDTVVLLLQKRQVIPGATPGAARRRDAQSDDVLSRLEVTVKAVLPGTGMGRFTLRPGPEPPLNAFVPLRLLQDQYDADKNKFPLKGHVNALLAGGVKSSLADALREHLTLADWGLALRTPADRARELFKMLAAGEDQWPSWNGKLRKYRWNGRISEELAGMAKASGELTVEQFIAFFEKRHGYLSLDSSQVFIEPALVTAVEKTVSIMGWQAAPTFAYMVDTLSEGEGEGRGEAAYAIVAALDPRLPAPLGPIQPQGVPPLGDGEILIAQWPDCPLKPAPGRRSNLALMCPIPPGKLERRQDVMKFAGWIPCKVPRTIPT